MRVTLPPTPSKVSGAIILPPPTRRTMEGSGLVFMPTGDLTFSKREMI